LNVTSHSGEPGLMVVTVVIIIVVIISITIINIQRKFANLCYYRLFHFLFYVIMISL
jgi:hypothetical protein